MDIAKSRQFGRALHNDPLIPVCYLISGISLGLAAATLLNLDQQAPVLIIYIDIVVGILSLGLAIWIHRSARMLPRRLFAAMIAVACLVALPTERQEPSSTLIISTIPVLIMILAEQSVWPIWLDPLFLIATILLSNTARVSAAFVAFHGFIFLTIGGVSVYARRNAERAELEARRAELEADRAENEGRIKRMFGSISHELNNAVTGIASLLPLVAEGMADDLFRKRSLNAIEWNILDIQRIANQLRLLAKTGDISLEQTVFPLKPLIDKLVIEAESWVALHGRAITIVSSCNPGLKIYGNEFWLGLYLRTLLKNCLEAIDQSGGSGLISVSVEQRDGLAITVADSGPGFPQDKLGHLNDRDSGIGTSKAAGTGIGIPFMKMVAGLHNARIIFANKPPGGAVVELRLRGSDDHSD